ncbi:MAG TPA: GNAT family N-acetyltransferase [Aestuariivirgaceae bacterium]|nr:GNAT family N-acetyltransferase [Aestuariivirgaceae bacterium]
MKSAAAGTEAYDDVELDAARLDDALALSTEANWNQVADDWRLLFREGKVFGRVRRRDRALVASAAVLPLGKRLAWIGMVLVTAGERRRGHARDLMRRALDHVAASGATAGLDATPAGLDLYRTLGFEDTDALMRMGCTLPSPPGQGAGGGVRRATTADLTRIIDYDAQAFGADRSAVLRDLQTRCPDAAFLAESRGKPTGLILARPGRVATQIGPLVADDPETAEHLLTAATTALSGPVIVDVFPHHNAMRTLLAHLGFTEQRPFTRMLNGALRLPNDRTGLSAGPELG